MSENDKKFGKQYYHDRYMAIKADPVRYAEFLAYRRGLRAGTAKHPQRSLPLTAAPKRRELTPEEKKARTKANHKRYYQKNKERLRAENRLYALAHRKETAARNRKYRKLNPERFAMYRENSVPYMKNYRLGPGAAEHYAEQVAKQAGKCAACGELPSTSSRRTLKLVQDHNHKTGQLRGALCSPCNRGMGLLRDSAERLRKLAEYLDSWAALWSKLNTPHKI